ncbi:aminoglycoside 6'-N-acetyltransferase [Arcicella rigui]|uniref:Aminoglycoside N(6')-acetyltransferase type 1 n=1 Tax=Arcicella rigui TaxID=797020 RepID=A0ABU5Q8K7_9BACT|nr:aminoglycoside 6'-N-acetyltransferase [Arcicella rigui]MEA5139175.1 aminoglycoside 6'-N-acetyltransferase [Arcicella rigui]
MQIEELSQDNLTDLTELVLEFWTECDFEEEYEAYKNIIEADDEICYLLQENNTYIGFIHLTLRHDYVEGTDDLPVAYIEALYIKAAYQREGFGKQLINVAELWAKQKGCSQLASDTELNNTKAIDFHKKAGFEEVNRIVCFVKNL